MGKPRIEQARSEEELARLAALGTRAAALTHELKNPAAAAQRATELLKEQLATLEPLASRLAEHTWQPDELQLFQQMARATAAIDPSARELDAVARSDREEEVGAWLEAKGIARARELAALLVERGVSVDQLARITSGCEARVVADAFAWTEHMATIRQLVDDVSQSTSRITDIVRAVKAYAYVDASAARTTDVHEGLENSLTIVGHKLRAAKVTVKREYDRTLPPLATFGTELNQVWTNLLDNAADALTASGDGTRVIRVRTSARGPGAGEIVVEIADSGAGIPAEIRARIFEPFFTTKEAGKGTGLGLDIVKRIIARHHGTLEVTSVPGDTRFIVRLPVSGAAPGYNASTAD